MDTREIFREGLSAVKARPSAIIVNVLAWLPLLFMSNLEINNNATGLLSLLGQLLVFAMLFLGIFMATVIINQRRAGQPVEAALAAMRERKVPVLLLALTVAAITFLTRILALMVVQLAAAQSLVNLEGVGLLVAEAVLTTLVNLLPALALVFVAFAAPIFYLSRLDQAGQVVETSYRLIKPRYGPAVKLYLAPEAVAWIVSFGFFIVPGGSPWLFLGVLLSIAFIHGAKAALQAAFFVDLYERVLEEEEAKRKAEKRAKSKAKPKAKPAAKKR
ncbi:MAG: hypothetical protein ACYC55_03780 [Candidatus Geothermincolia bacterium]